MGTIPNLVGAGLIVIGAGLGLGKIGGSAMDAIARQPEAAGKIQFLAMIIIGSFVGRFSTFRSSCCFNLRSLISSIQSATVGCRLYLLNKI